MSDDDIEALCAALEEARRAGMALDHERDAAKRALLVEVEAKVNEIFGARVGEAQKRIADAQMALSEAEERCGLAKHSDMYQGVLIEWRYDRFRDYEKTGRRGKYEVCTTKTIFANNQRFGLPQPGERFIRVLKKDGSPGLAFVTENYFSRCYWLPEGEKPKGAAA